MFFVSVSFISDLLTCVLVCVCMQFRMKESGVAEIVKSETGAVSASQSSHSSSSASDISPAVKSASQNGTGSALAVIFGISKMYTMNALKWQTTRRSIC